MSDFFSNFRVYKKETVPLFSLRGGETFGGELLVVAKKCGFKIGEVLYEPPPDAVTRGSAAKLEPTSG